ncbi:MAG: twin-arginine translocase subunit TatC [Nocardioidaceae bacterium]|nr:twin-arginine translocase subunit TatC [Nocardioidaceae bacterium]
MPLLEHLRELRSRLGKAVLAIVVASVACAFLYGYLIELLRAPFEDAIAKLAEERNLNAQLTINDPAGPFLLQLKISLVAGLVAASPVWLWQLWAFIVPGLHRTERKWSMLFAAIAGPLFMAGVLLGYYVLPKGLGILLDFTPADVSNFIELDRYLNFILRMMLVFGVAFEIPLFVVLLNLAGVVSGKMLGRSRPWIVLGTFVFAAVATPSTDPISMLFLAAPMTVLFLISEVIARLIDRRRARSEGSYESYDDDEASDIETMDDPDDNRPSRLTDDD